MPMRIQVLALVLSLRLLASQEPGAGTDLERADGVRLSVRRDAESVRVLDGERAVARYGRAGGDLRLREGAVALSFHAEGAAPAGALRSLHAGFAPPRLADGGGTEAAAISERLRWLDASGRAVLDEQRTVTVLAPEAAGVTVLWESYLSPVLGAGPAALAAAGLRVSLDPSLAGGTFLAAGEAAPRPELRGVRAGWCAWRAAGSTGPAGPAGPLAVALHGPAAGQRRPLAGSGAAGPGPWLEASAAGDGPLLLRPGERLAVRLAIVVHEEAPDAARLEEGQARAARLLGDEAPALEPGLLARYGAARGKEAVEVRRIEPKLSHDWRGGMPDERLPAGPFRAEWAGRLLVTEDGEHRFVLAARGAAKALVDGALVAATEATPVTSSAAAGGAGPAAVATGTVTLEYGYHELEVEYDAPGEGAAISLSWAMRDGPADVIPARSLAHDAAAGAALDGDFAYERGRLLASRLGCEGCHGPTGGASSAAGPGSWTRAPPLTHAAWLQRGYIESLLAAPGDGRPRSLHPALRGDPARALEDSRALAAFLVAVSAPRPEPLSLPPGSAKRGGELFEAIGCAACHEARGAAGGSGLLEGDPMAPPRLAGTGDKWPTDALVRFLREPRAFRPRGLMPDLRLGEMDAVDIAAFLSSLGVGEPRGEPAPPDPA
ncbi:MAG: PmoA family protein, partial [Planctomycetes bacterium]|nr:PmoA family protein [Planctomycetota bacterium]